MPGTSFFSDTFVENQSFKSRPHGAKLENLGLGKHSLLGHQDSRSELKSRACLQSCLGSSVFGYQRLIRSHFKPHVEVQLSYIWEKGAIEARSKISQKRPKSGLFEPERLRGHYVVTTRSLRGHYAVTTVTTRSLRSLRGHYAVTTVTTRSPRGHFAVKKSYTFEAEKTLNFAPKRPIRSRHCCRRPRRL